MDTVADLKAEARTAIASRASWRENEQRLIWCGQNDDGTFDFRNTTSATSKGPKISEKEADRILAEEGPWLRPSRLHHIAGPTIEAITSDEHERHHSD